MTRARRRCGLRLALALCIACAGAAASADVFRPAYLELREAGEGRYDVLWKVPARGDEQRLAVHVRFPDDTVVRTPPRGVFVGGAYVERWQIERAGGLAGETVRIEGLAGGVTDVIVRIERADGSSLTDRVLPERPEFVVAEETGPAAVAASYLRLGFEHILGGADHLLFVLALLFIVRGGLRIFATITAFTLAHSATLAAATLGLVRLPGPPVEATIALSIVFVAAEVVHGQRGAPGLTARAPWLVAFLFGLLHGLGFAGALAEIGLPEGAIPLALLFFNLGVEVGQLVFVVAVLSAAAAFARFAPQLPRWTPDLAAYAIGAIASFWLLERIAAF